MLSTTDGTLSRAILRLALATAFLLLLPLVAMHFTKDVAWGPGDFVVAGILLFGAGLTYQLLSKKAPTAAYRAAIGVAVATVLLLVWVNLAVGIIGGENDSANLMYAGVLAVLIIGGVVARLRSAGMARALFATALAQLSVAAIARFAGWSSTSLLDGFFVALWIGSAFLFRRAARTS